MTLTETRSDIAEFMSRLDMLLSVGAGYAEVRRHDEEFPMLAFSFKDGYGVVHLFDSPDDCNLLRGDEVLPSTETVDLPVHGEESTFSGDFVSTVARGAAAVTAFVQGAAVEELGHWDRLWRDPSGHAATSSVLPN
jgi:hypothetical protein